MTNEKLKELIGILDTSRKLISVDVYYCIYDTDCIVQYIYPEDGDKDGIQIGTKFVDPTGKLEEVLETEKCIHNFIPMDRFGFYMEGNLIPVYEDGKLCGAISSAYIPMNQQQLIAREMAVQSIYYLIMSIDMKNNNHCNRLYFNYETQQFPTDAQHFDDFCEKSISYVHPDDVEQFQSFTEVSQVYKKLQTQKVLTMECRFLNISGEYRWAELILTRTNEPDESNIYNTAVYMVRDIHERKAKELDILQKNQNLIIQLEKNNNLLFEQGMTDELSKVYNRKGLVWFGDSLLETAKINNQNIYTLVADLNGLKYINDKFGHEEGDRAIKTIADILQDVVSQSAIVCRTGGDEFTVIDMLEKDSKLPEEIEEKLLRDMRNFNETSNLPYKVEASYGWDCRPALEIKNLDACVNSADNKMYDMKTRTSTLSRFFGESQNKMNRQFVSAKQNVWIVSPSDEFINEVVHLFDPAIHFISTIKSTEKARQKLDDNTEMVMLFIDNRLKEQSGVEFMKTLTDNQRQNVVPILLIEKEYPDIISEAFDMGMADVLTKPYNTLLHKNRIKLFSKMNTTNLTVVSMLDKNEVKKDGQ